MSYAIAIEYETPVFQNSESCDVMVSRLRILWNPHDKNFANSVRPDSPQSNNYQICAANNYWCFFPENNPCRVIIHSRYDTDNTKAGLKAFGDFYAHRFGGKVFEATV